MHLPPPIVFVCRQYVALSELSPVVVMDLIGLKNKASSQAHAHAMAFSGYIANTSKKVVLWALTHGEEADLSKSVLEKVADQAAAPILIPSYLVYLIGFLLVLNLVFNGFVLWERFGLDFVKYLQGCTSTSGCI
jgi:hypothetical protein